MKLRSDAIYKLCSTSSSIEDIRSQQGFIYAIDAYIELENELNNYQVETEEHKKRVEAMKNNYTQSQAEAMRII